MALLIGSCNCSFYINPHRNRHSIWFTLISYIFAEFLRIEFNYIPEQNRIKSLISCTHTNWVIKAHSLFCRVDFGHFQNSFILHSLVVIHKINQIAMIVRMREDREDEAWSFVMERYLRGTTSRYDGVSSTGQQYEFATATHHTMDRPLNRWSSSPVQLHRQN